MMKRYAVMVAVGICFSILTGLVLSVVNFARGEEHADQQGTHIHRSEVDGYGFDYSLYHFPERKTWHLMVSITGPGGTKASEGKVGFLIVGPEGLKQKVMAMGMKGAFGADVDFGKKGAYTVKVKAVIGDKKLFDRFKYEVK